MTYSGEYHWRDDCIYCADIDDWVYSEREYNCCDSCGECYYYYENWEECCDNNRENPNLHRWDYKPAPVFLGGAEEYNTFFGVEIEYHDFPDYIDNDSRYYLKEDSSLENGAEIVTHPFTRKRYQENKDKFIGVVTDIYNSNAYTDNGS